MRVLRRAASISIATGAYGVAFGVFAIDSGLSWLEALAFSAVVFTGSAQFAAAGVLGSGGTVSAAILAGALLNVRSLAFGVAMAPRMPRGWMKRALWSHLMIDESVAVATAEQELHLQRFGYLAGGLGVFALWNLATMLGATIAIDTSDFVSQIGLDATIPAAFLALLWPRLQSGQHRIAAAGALIAVAAVTWTPAGMPILLAAFGVVVGSAPAWRRSAS